MFQLESKGYVFDAEQGIWMRPEFAGIAYNDGDSAENRLARIVRQATDTSVFSAELRQQCRDWQTLYHLSSQRGNVLRPFAHLLKGRTLEIGAGCGAITRYLGEAGGQVLALEGSPRRAAIASSRTRDLDNVTVLAERFEDFQSEERFDAITLIGVLEYANLFTPGETPTLRMLQKVLQLLKPDGQLLIAIENQLGLKYFAGAPEDHLGQSMYGIEGRYRDGQPQTFGRHALDLLLRQAGYAAIDFLAPFPDYKFPKSIVTERGSTTPDFDAAALAWQSVLADPQLPPEPYFNLGSAWPVVFENRLGMELANSFIIAASPRQQSALDADILAFHYSTERRIQFCKEALFRKTLNQGIEVVYRPLAQSSQADSDIYRFDLPEKESYRSGQVFSQRYLELFKRPGWTLAELATLIGTHCKYLLDLSGIARDVTDVTTRTLLPAEFLDALPQNIIIAPDGTPQLFDLEWRATTDVELGNIVFRGLFFLLHHASEIAPLAEAPGISRRGFIERAMEAAGLPLDEADLTRYLAREIEFQQQVTGVSQSILEDWKPDSPLVPDHTSAVQFASLYFASADEEYSEGSALRQQIRPGRQQLCFTIDQAQGAIARLRLDPVDQPTWMVIHDIVVLNSQQETLWRFSEAPDQALRADIQEIFPGQDANLFYSIGNDPYLLVPQVFPAQAGLEVRVDLELLNKQQVVAQFVRQTADLADLQSKYAQAQNELASTQQHVRNLMAHLQQAQEAQSSLANTLALTHSSLSWKLTRPLRFAGRRLREARFKLAPVTHRMKRLVIVSQNVIQREQGLVPALKKGLRILKRDGLSGFRSRLRRENRALLLSQSPDSPLTGGPPHDDYTQWISNFDSISDDYRQKLIDAGERLALQPKISVVMPVYNPPLHLLEAAIQSVITQTYSHWELCIADDASKNEGVREVLDRFSAADPRVKVVYRENNGHISNASNSALEIASGDYIALMDQDDLLAEHALYTVAKAINENPDAGVLYSDEDKIDEQGKRSAPYFKSDWNLYLFRSQNMISHLGVYRRDLVESVGGFRVGYEGSQDYDLALRCIERLEYGQIVHIPHVLYHWRIHSGSTALASDEKPYAALAGLKALGDHLQRTGCAGEAMLLPIGMYRVQYQVPEPAPLVSLIIPTRNARELVKQCIDSILALTTYPAYEILLVDNGSDDPAALEYFAKLPQDGRIKVIRDDGPFNYSALNNNAVRQSRGEYIGLINNDIEVITPQWLEEMVALAAQPGVGAVGARLWYPDDKLQHAGVVIGMGGVAGHAHRLLPRDHGGYFGRAMLTQEFSAVTAACLLVSRKAFEELGGLNEVQLKVAFNDVDFCLRLLEAGYTNVWTPYAELYHHESASRGAEDTPEKQARFEKEVDYMLQRWPDILSDYAYNPNLTLSGTDFGLGWPPRVCSVLEKASTTGAPSLARRTLSQAPRPTDPVAATTPEEAP